MDADEYLTRKMKETSERFDALKENIKTLVNEFQDETGVLVSFHGLNGSPVYHWPEYICPLIISENEERRKEQIQELEEYYNGWFFEKNKYVFSCPSSSIKTNPSSDVESK